MRTKYFVDNVTKTSDLEQSVLDLGDKTGVEVIARSLAKVPGSKNLYLVETYKDNESIVIQMTNGNEWIKPRCGFCHKEITCDNAYWNDGFCTCFDCHQL